MKNRDKHTVKNYKPNAYKDIFDKRKSLLSDKSIKIEPYYLKYGPKHIGLVTTTKPYEQ